MKPEALAIKIEEFLKRVPKFWENLRDLIIGHFEVIKKEANVLWVELTESKSKFVETISILILRMRKTSGIWFRIFKYILNKVLMGSLDKLDKDWLDKIK